MCPGREGSVERAAVRMVLLSVLLFWAPVVGPLVAGFVGGRMAGGTGPAVLAAVLPAALAAALFLLVGSHFALHVLGATVGTETLVVVLVESPSLILGAAVGGAAG